MKLKDLPTIHIGYQKFTVFDMTNQETWPPERQKLIVYIRSNAMKPILTEFTPYMGGVPAWRLGPDKIKPCFQGDVWVTCPKLPERLVPDCFKPAKKRKKT